MDKKLLISVVILTWNSEKHVIRCLSSLIKCMGSIDFEIIIVDNGSIDKTVETINRNFPFVTLIINKTNRGVAPARNQGISIARGKYILILDIDTLVYEDAIMLLINHMEQNLEVGLCGPQLCFEDGTIQNSCRRFPLLYTKVLRRINFKWAKELLKNEYYIKEKERAVNDPIYVDYVIGACQLIRYNAILDVGMLDDRIFYGPEDVDFCLRLWLKGWKVQYLSQATVIHYEQRITKKRFFSYITIKHVQGLLYFFIKHRYLFSRKSLYQRIPK